MPGYKVVFTKSGGLLLSLFWVLINDLQSKTSFKHQSH